MVAKFFRFLVAGGLTTILAYVVFVGVIGAGLSYRLANPMAWALTVGVGATLNRRFTFRADIPRKRWFALYVVGALLQLALSTIGYEILIGRFGMQPTLAFVINTGFTAAVTFLCLNFITFQRA